LILLDTHILIWFVQGSGKLRPLACEKVATAFERSEAAVSAISFWEIAMLARKQRLPLTEPVSRWLARLRAARNLHIEAVSWEIAAVAGDLPDEVHGDPADRIIVATARERNWELLSADHEILAYAAAGHIRAVDANA
jgi:PIN domain nuclease of toxin-antitoxin system